MWTTILPVSYTHLDVYKRQKLDWKAQKEEQARLRKVQSQLKKVEEEISLLEDRDRQIDQLLITEQVYTDHLQVHQLNEEKQEIASRLEELYEKWEQLAEE